MTSDSSEEFNRQLAEGKYSVFLEDHDIALPAVLWALVTFMIVLFWLMAHLSLVALWVGVSSTLIGLACFAIRERLLRHFSYMGVKREAISKAVSYFDLRCTKPNQMDPVAQSRSLNSYVRVKSAERAQAALNLVVHMANRVKWPCSEIEKLHEYVKWVYATAKCTGVTAAAILLVAGFFYAFSLVLGTLLLIMFGLTLCMVEIVELHRNRKVLLYGRYLDRVECLEDIELTQTTAQLLELLASELKWPIRFYLAGDYEGLVYTGRRQTTYGPYRLKEAVLYPRRT